MYYKPDEQEVDCDKHTEEICDPVQSRSEIKDDDKTNSNKRNHELQDESFVLVELDMIVMLSLFGNSFSIIKITKN